MLTGVLDGWSDLGAPLMLLPPPPLPAAELESMVSCVLEDWDGQDKRHI
jgi:hypothetical protein